MLIYYVHHAERCKRGHLPEDDGITNLGKQDAIDVGKLFYKMSKNKKSNYKFKSIYTSSFYRCKKTAELLNRKLKLEIVEDERLNEFNSKCESWIELQERVRKSLYNIVCKHEENNIVICVTSGVNLVAFTSLAYRLKPSSNAPFMIVPSSSVVGFNITKENFEE